MLKNLKYDIYQRTATLFPRIFKKKTFSKIGKLIAAEQLEGLPEKELLVLHKIVSNDAVIIDVGANNGLYCYYFQEFLSNPSIFAFEPIPSLYRKLTKWFDGIYISPIAISNVSGEATIHIPFINNVKYETRAKLDMLKEHNETSTKMIHIKTKSLDELFLEKLNRLDLIKIDIEGHELAALKGGEALIRKTHPILMVEIEARHHEANPWEVLHFITSLDYEVTYFDAYKKQFIPISEFSFGTNQQVTETNQHKYINNFIAFPKNKIDYKNINSTLA